MKVENRIAYYCFNRKCSGSVYFRKSVQITELPFTATTLSHYHLCGLCRSKLISKVDIEIRQALSATKQDATLPVYGLSL